MSPAVLLAVEDSELTEELARYFDELSNWRVPRSVNGLDELIEALAGSSFDAVIVSDELARTIARQRIPLGTSRIVVIAKEERVDSMRAALAIGARGFVVWPAQRRDLKWLVESGSGSRGSASRSSAPLTAVWSPKGGAGASVISAHLAASMTAHSERVLLVDLALDQGDQSTILGADGESKSLFDLLRVVDEIDAEVVSTVAFKHRLGFDAVLAPGSNGDRDLVKASDLLSVLGALRGHYSHVIADLPSAYGELQVSLAEEATKVVLVITPDILSLKRCRDLIRTLKAGGMDPDKLEVIANQFALADVTVSDIEAVTGRPLLARIKPELGIFKSAGKAELSPKTIQRLAHVAAKLAAVRS